MHDSIKESCFAVFFVSGIVCAFAWYAQAGDSTNWIRLVSTVVAVLTLIVFLKLHLKPDQVPDYLAKRHGNAFENRGVSVVFEPAVLDGIFYLNIYFQCKFTGDAVIHVGLRPKQGLLGRAKGLDLHLGPIDCPPAGYGVMRWPIPVPLKLQGKKMTFEVGLSATYPKGKGTQARFRSGLRVGHKADFVRHASSNFLTIKVISYTPAQCTIQLPANVAESLPIEVGEQDEIFWQLGDDPLSEIS